MRDLTKWHERRLRLRTTRRKLKRAERRSAVIESDPGRAAARTSSLAVFRDSVRMIAEIGVDPKYLSAHARRRLGAGADDAFVLRRATYLEARDRAVVDQRRAEGKTVFSVGVRS